MSTEILRIFFTKFEQLFHTDIRNENVSVGLNRIIAN